MQTVDRPDAARPRSRARSALRVAGILLALILLAAAIVPWTVNPVRLAALVNAQTRADFGLTVEGRGRTSVALLPVPRFRLGGATIADARGRPLVRDARLRGEVRLVPLLFGRVELTELTIVGGRILADAGAAGGAGWAEVLARIRARAAAGATDGIGRLVVAGSALEIRGTDAGTVTVRELDLLVNWPSPGGDLQAAGSGTWRGEKVAATAVLRQPLGLGEGRAAPFDVQASGRPGRIALRGELSRRDGWRFDGQTSGEAASLGALARWLGTAPPAGLDVPVAFGGAATMTADEVGWSRLHLDLAGDALEGALSVRTGEGGPEARATLAAGRLDLGWLAQAGLPSLRAWAEGSAPPRLLARTRLDLRLSASSVEVGPLRLGECALSVLVDEGRLDAALLRAGLDRGSLKGRLAASFEGGRPDLKGQAAFEGVDASKLLAAFGGASWLAGTARGQANFEIAGGPDLVRQLVGRLSVTLMDGGIAGLNLGATLRRSPDEATAVALRPGRTAFSRAQLNLAVANGIAEVDDGSSIQAEDFRAALQGRISLPDRFVSVRADATLPGVAGAAASTMVVDVNGPWSAPVVQRSAETVAPPAAQAPP